MDLPELNMLPDLLLPWYYAGHRDLPWRADREPYHIWLSEIMLQQTRVEAVRGYYTRFLRELPDIAALAACDDDRLNKLWEGLGYYSRVRNLKKAAGIIVSRFGGSFPSTYEEVLALPGIGPYTAGAVCSIAFDRKTPAVDGNVLRLWARLANDASPVDLPDTRRRAQEALAAVYPDAAGDFTQALIELGATLCGPDRKPECAACPCRGICLACRCGSAEKLPVRLPKKGRRREALTVLVIRCGDRYGLRRRPKRGLLAGMWEFPNTPGILDEHQAAAFAEQLGCRPSEIRKMTSASHVFTHIEWDMRAVYMEAAEPSGALQWFSDEELDREAALPTAFRQFRETPDPAL